MCRRKCGCSGIWKLLCGKTVGNIERHQMLFRCCSTYTVQALFSCHLCAEDMVLVYATIWLLNYRVSRLVASSSYGSQSRFHLLTYPLIGLALLGIARLGKSVQVHCSNQLLKNRVHRGAVWWGLLLTFADWCTWISEATSKGIIRWCLFIDVYPHIPCKQYSVVMCVFRIWCDLHNNLVFRL